MEMLRYQVSLQLVGSELVSHLNQIILMVGHQAKNWHGKYTI